MKIKKLFLLNFIILLIFQLDCYAQVKLTATGPQNTFNLQYPANTPTLVNGLMVTFFSNQTITGATQLNLNGTGPIDILKNVTLPLASGDILAGQPVTVIFDGTFWQMLSPSANTPTSNLWTSSGINMFPTNLSSNLGIGTSTPGYNLDINGKLNFSFVTSSGISIGGNPYLWADPTYSVNLGFFSGNPSGTGNFNTSIGYFAGSAITIGNYNVFQGYQAGYKTNTGYNNVMIGSYAGNNNQTGQYNTFIGNYAGATNVGGYGNIMIGNYADLNNSWVNSVAIGSYATVGGNYMMALGGTGSNALSVGIGTGIPQTILDLRKDVSGGTGPILSLSNFGGSSGAASAIDFYAFQSIGPGVRIRAVDDGNYSENLTFITKTPGADANPLVERMRLTSDGTLSLGNTTPAVSAIVEINSNSKGFLPPRMTTAQRQAIISPVQGLTIYNITTNCLEYYDGTAWNGLCSSYGVANFVYTGSPQTFTVPTNVTSIFVVAKGAGGVGGSGTFGGSGGYVSCSLAVTPNQVLTILVGGGGAGATSGGCLSGGGGGYSAIFNGITVLVGAGGGGSKGNVSTGFPGGPTGANVGGGLNNSGSGTAGVLNTGGTGNSGYAGGPGFTVAPCGTSIGGAGGYGGGGGGGYRTGSNTGAGAGGGGFPGGSGGLNGVGGKGGTNITGAGTSVITSTSGGGGIGSQFVGSPPANGTVDITW